MRSSRALSSALLALATLAGAAPAAADITVFEAPSVADFKLDLYGWVQPRFTYQQQDNRPSVLFDPIPAFNVQRARLGTVASLGPWARAQVEIDFSGQYALPFDAFVVLSPIHEKAATLNLTAGQFRVPFSRQNLLPSVAYQLPDVAYFVAPSFLVDRDIGGKIWSDLFEGRLRLQIGMFDGNNPGKGQAIKTDPDFLAAARVEVSPFGAAPRFEGDLRPLSAQHHFILTLAASAMRHRADEVHFNRNYVGADLAAYWEGASLYGEFYYHIDDPILVPGVPARPARQAGGVERAGRLISPLALGARAPRGRGPRRVLRPLHRRHPPRRGQRLARSQPVEPHLGIPGLRARSQLLPEPPAHGQGPGQLRDPRRDQALPPGPDRAQLHRDDCQQPLLGPDHRGLPEGETTDEYTRVEQRFA